jgi:hypothetical protein
LKIVLQTLREHKLYANFDKCDFYQRKIQYLGHVISKDGIGVDPENIKAIMEWPVPKNIAYIYDHSWGLTINNRGLSKDFPKFPTLLHHYRKKGIKIYLV